MDILGAIISIIRAIFGLVIIFFLPGFAITWILYLTHEEIAPITRIALSFILSLATLMLTTLFLDYVIGVDTTPVNILVTLGFIIIVIVAIWKIRWYIRMKPVRREITPG